MRVSTDCTRFLEDLTKLYRPTRSTESGKYASLRALSHHQSWLHSLEDASSSHATADTH